MTNPVVKLLHLPISDPDGRRRELFITINGRQALAEGPRRVGYCVYCKSQCRGATALCAARVFDER